MLADVARLYIMGHVLPHGWPPEFLTHARDRNVPSKMPSYSAIMIFVEDVASIFLDDTELEVTV